MDIVKYKVADITPYEKNAKKHDDRQIKNVMESIKQFGFVQPVVIDRDGVLIIGHCRLEAAKRLGMEEVDTVIADSLTPEQVDKLRLLDNKLNESDWDMDLLLEGISELDFEGFDVDWDTSVIEEDEVERKKREFEERMAAGEISEEDEEYQEFLKKFELKKTTDDCYTPPKVYDAVVKYCVERYGIKESDIVRPFYPGGDYVKEKYPKNCVVVDNPPFSILAEILNFYKEKKIRYMLFAPALTLFSSSSSSSTAICTGSAVIYENGAVVNTSFLTNLDDRRIRFKSDPILRKMVDDAVTETLKETRKQQPKYSYPLSVVTSPMMSQYSRYGIDFEVSVEESIPISQLDSQKESGKAIYGKGYLINDKKKAERKKAEREKAEREKAERWELSEREIKLIKSMDRRDSEVAEEMERM